MLWDIIAWYLSSAALMGAVVPLVISLGIVFLQRKSVLRRPTYRGWAVLSVLLVVTVLNYSCGFWTADGYHIIPYSMIVVWGLVYYRLLPPIMAYPSMFFTSLVPDVVGAGVCYQWGQGFWDVVGGYGLTDGLFVYPLVALLTAYLVRYSAGQSPKVSPDAPVYTSS